MEEVPISDRPFLSKSRILQPLRSKVESLRQDLSLFSVGEIARRYFVMNAFDGALTILGIVVGFVISGEEHPRIVLTSGAGASLAMGISGAVGAYMAEIAERRQELRELEHHMFQSLRGSRMARAIRVAALWVALVDGISPALAAAIPLIPFWLVSIGVLTIQTGIVVSIAFNLAMLFALGAFLGKVSGERIWLRGFLMVGAGIITMLILLAASAL